MGFTEQDVKTARRFGELVGKHAQWELNTSTAIELVRLMSGFNQLVEKIEAHIMELRSVTLPKSDPPAPAAPSRRKRGA